MKTLQQIQAEIGAWAQKQFGVNSTSSQSHHQTALLEIPSFYGIVSELGELAALDVREMQGRSKLPTPEARQDAREDAVADLMVFLCDYCCRMGIDLNVALDRTWAKVSQRRQATWEQDKAKEAAPEIARDLTTGRSLKEFNSRPDDATANFGAGCDEGNHSFLQSTPINAKGECEVICKECQYTAVMKVK